MADELTSNLKIMHRYILNFGDFNNKKNHKSINQKIADMKSFI